MMFKPDTWVTLGFSAGRRLLRPQGPAHCGRETPTGCGACRDFAGRNGGEEFAVLLPDTGIPAAPEIAERIRAAAAALSPPGADVSVTASLDEATGERVAG